MIYLEKHGAQVCKEQRRWLWPGPADPRNSLPRRTKHTGPALVQGMSWGSVQWGGLGQTELGCHRPNTEHSWLRKFSEWKMLRKWEILWGKYPACFPHCSSGLRSLLKTKHWRGSMGPAWATTPITMSKVFLFFFNLKNPNTFTVSLPADKNYPQKPIFSPVFLH